MTNRATLTAYCSQCGTRFTLTCRGPQVTSDAATMLYCPVCAWWIDLTLEGFERRIDGDREDLAMHALHRDRGAPR